MAASGRIPATVVTGFLGAGKTTLVRHLIENARGRRLALIVNEFGDIGIDGELLSACTSPDCGSDDIFELANGCICCTVADEFLPTIQRIIARNPPPDTSSSRPPALRCPSPWCRRSTGPRCAPG